MKTLAIIGASYLQLPLVRKAKEMGLRTICFAWADGAVCASECDVFYPVSIVDKEKILEICQIEHIDGITSIASDVAVPTIAYVAERMMLVGNSTSSAAKSTNKYLMRKALHAAGVPCPKFAVVGDISELDSCIADMAFPLVVKPTDRSGSMGVTRIDDRKTLVEAVSVAIDASFCRKAIVEECIADMREVSVEGISWNGRYNMLQITDKLTTGAPHYVELAHHQPAILTEDERSRISDIVERGVAALEINCGATHAELMIAADGQIYVTEIGARMGGDFIGSDLVRLSTGYDFLKGVILCALGCFEEVAKGKDSQFSGVWFYTIATKWVRNVIENHAGDKRIVDAKLLNDDTIPLTRSADRSGYFIYQSQSGRYCPKEEESV